jgi:hypothetical protein
MCSCPVKPLLVRAGMIGSSGSLARQSPLRLCVFASLSEGGVCHAFNDKIASFYCGGYTLIF